MLTGYVVSVFRPYGGNYMWGQVLIQFEVQFESNAGLFSLTKITPVRRCDPDAINWVSIVS